MSRATPLAPELTVIDGHVTTTSLDVARHFGKRHGHVLRTIRDLAAQLPSERQPNFGLTSLEVIGPNGGTRSEPAYRITRDGFTLLAMGFTGARALEFKLAYLDAFNRMEAEVARRVLPAPDKTAQAIRLSGALEAAGRIGSQVQAEAFERFMRDEQFDGGRWLLGFRYDAEAQAYRPRLDRIESGACVLTPESFLKALSEPNGIPVTRQVLLNFIRAATDRLESTLNMLESQAAGKPVKLQW